MRSGTRYGGVRSTVFTRKPGEEAEPREIAEEGLRKYAGGDTPGGAFETVAEIADRIFDPAAAPEAIAEGLLYREPLEEILVFGLMQYDAREITKQLAARPQAGEGYRGSLRIVIAAARALQARATGLLGDGPDD